MKKVKFDIQGMTCSSCSAHVEKAVNKLLGVKSVNVNLLSNNMIVEYDEQKINNDKLIKAVVDAGYGAEIANNEKITKKSKENDNIKLMKKRLLVSIVFLIPLMYLAMYHMFENWFGIPTPRIYKKFISWS